MSLDDNCFIIIEDKLDIQILNPNTEYKHKLTLKRIRASEEYFWGLPKMGHTNPSAKSGQLYLQIDETQPTYYKIKIPNACIIGDTFQFEMKYERPSNHTPIIKIPYLYRLGLDQIVVRHANFCEKTLVTLNSRGKIIRPNKASTSDINWNQNEQAYERDNSPPNKPFAIAATTSEWKTKPSLIALAGWIAVQIINKFLESQFNHTFFGS